MNNLSNQNGSDHPQTFSFADPDFYLRKIIDTLLHPHDLQKVGEATFSFFSGSDYVRGQQVTVDSRHFEIIFIDDQLSAWCRLNPRSTLKWIETMYFYFRSMSAIPEIAASVWPWAEKIVRTFRGLELEAYMASCQLASWDFFYGKEHHPSYLEYMKTLPLKDQLAKKLRYLFNSTYINLGHEDYLENTKQAYKNRKSFTGANTALAIINYYCHVEQQEQLLDELITFMTGKQMQEDVLNGHIDFLKPLIGKLHEENKYESLLKLLRRIKKKTCTSTLQHSHGFIISNSKKLSILSCSGKDEFESTDNYESYKNLIRVSNISTNTSISLLGEVDEDVTYYDQTRRGAPPVENDLELLRLSVIKHFRLDNSMYSELHTATLVPSHNFPIQSALFSIGKPAPIISVSLEDIIDDPSVKNFIFFISSSTSTCNIERDFIEREFGEHQEIIIDPTPELFTQKLSSRKYDIIYISAHGEYDHWDDSQADEIYFNETSRISVELLKRCIPEDGHKRNIILNICDGATVTISCNPYSRGMAAALARGNQTTISHLWPVSPVYACAFGTLILHFIKSHTAIDAARLTFNTLNNDLDQIIRSMISLSESFTALQDYLNGKRFIMREFKNIGSVAVYS